MASDGAGKENVNRIFSVIIVYFFIVTAADGREDEECSQQKWTVLKGRMYNNVFCIILDF